MCANEALILGSHSVHPLLWIANLGLLAVATLAGGCSADTSADASETVGLPDYRDWLETTADQDPLVAHRPPGGIWCTGVWVEAEQLEMITSQCNYASRTAVLLEPIQPGTVLQGTLGHEQLAPTQGETAIAHAAVAIGQRIVWEQEVQVPAEPSFIDIEVELDEGADAGEPITIHLHNHGLNHYTWSPFTLSSPFTSSSPFNLSPSK